MEAKISASFLVSFDFNLNDQFSVLPGCILLLNVSTLNSNFGVIDFNATATSLEKTSFSKML
ncbi:hypothetical protein D3C87_2190780 [compost metagenome]